MRCPLVRDALCIVIAAFVVLPGLAGVVRAEPRQANGIWREWQPKRPATLSHDAAGKFPKGFVCLVALRRSGGAANAPSLLAVVQKTPQGAAVLFLDAKRNAIAYLGEGQCICLDASGKSDVLQTPGGGRLTAGPVPGAEEVGFDARAAGGEDLAIRVRIADIVESYPSDGTYDRRTHSYRVVTKSGGKLRVRPDLRAGHYPTAELVAEGRKGGALEIGPVCMGAAGGPRITELTEDKLAKAGVDVRRVPVDDFNKALSALVASNPGAVGFSADLQAAIGDIPGVLELLARDRKGSALAQLIQSCGEKEELDELVVLRLDVGIRQCILQPILASRGRYVLFWAYDRKQAASSLSAAIGARHVKTLYEVLGEVLESSRERSTLLECLNVIGDLGSEAGAPVLQQLSAKMASDSAIRAAVASVRARWRQADRRDLAAMEAALHDAEVPLEARLMALEGLALQDALTGKACGAALDLLLVKETDEATGAVRRPPVRYRMSLAHGPKSRADLVKRLTDADDAPDDRISIIVSALGNGISADHLLWTDIASAAAKLARSDHRRIDVRKRAFGLLVRAGRVGASLRDTVAKEWVASSDSGLVDMALVSMVGFDGNTCTGAEYLALSRIAMDNKAPKARKSAFRYINGVKVPFGKDFDPTDLFVRGLADSDETVRQAALTALRRAVDWNGYAKWKESHRTLNAIQAIMRDIRSAPVMMCGGAYAMEALTHGKFKTPGSPPRNKAGQLRWDVDWWSQHAADVRKAVVNFSTEKDAS